MITFKTATLTTTAEAATAKAAVTAVQSEEEE